MADAGVDAAGALRAATKKLEAISDTPRLDAELLLAHALGIAREKLLLDMPKLPVPGDYDDLLTRRLTAEPIAHILGVKEFWDLEFQVSADVLIPRPDSETLIEEALKIFTKTPPKKILDLGTGSGALLLAALHEFPHASGTGIDNSSAALQIAHNNADGMGLSDRAEFILQDWGQQNWVDGVNAPFDLVLANPPYISSETELSAEVVGFEPHEALFAGKDGLDDYRIILRSLSNLLNPEGVALFEIGFDQAETVSKLAQTHSYHVECKQDLAGHDRVLILRK